MSLDQNLFTLNLIRNGDDVDLVDPSNMSPYYRKRRSTTSNTGYEWSLYDPLSLALLATVTADAPTSKKKAVQLHDPPVTVELAFSGTISFKWTFTWEGHEMEWRKEECFLIRKPDPPVMIAVTSAEKKNKPASVQLLDYNINRFDIQDRKGLEITILTCLLTFSDYTEGFHSLSSTEPSSTPAIQEPPRAPYKPVVRNELRISDQHSVQEYADYGVSVLQDNDTLYIIIRAHSPNEVNKVVQVAEQVKLQRHRLLDSGDDLHQYVSYDNDEQTEEKGKKKKRIIKLDDPDPQTKDKKPDYKPVSSLTIHLSKVPMPELAPKGFPSSSSPPPAATPNSTSAPSSSSFWRPKNSQRPSDPSKIPIISPQPPSPPSGKSSKLSKPKDKKKDKQASTIADSSSPPRISMSGPGTDSRYPSVHSHLEEKPIPKPPQLNYSNHPSRSPPPNPSLFPTPSMQHSVSPHPNQFLPQYQTRNPSRYHPWAQPSPSPVPSHTPSPGPPQFHPPPPPRPPPSPRPTSFAAPTSSNSSSGLLPSSVNDLTIIAGNILGKLGSRLNTTGAGTGSGSGSGSGK